MKKLLLSTLAMLILSSSVAFAADSQNVNLAPGLKYKDAYNIVGEKNLYTGYEAYNQDGTVNAVIAIPAGTTPKWEIDDKTGGLNIELRNGKPRVINYLGYPGNFGIVPKTVGADGEVLAVLVIGDTVPRGSVVKTKIIGAIKLINTRNVATDKLIAVQEGSPLYAVNSIAEMNQKYPGVSNIIETWFTNYNGIGKMKSNGIVDVEEANTLLTHALNEFNLKK